MLYTHWVGGGVQGGVWNCGGECGWVVEGVWVIGFAPVGQESQNRHREASPEACLVSPGTCHHWPLEVVCRVQSEHAMLLMVSWGSSYQGTFVIAGAGTGSLFLS